MNNKKKIAIVAGGYSSEKVVSLKSAQGIASFMDTERYDIAIVLITETEWTVQLPDGNSVPLDKNDFGYLLDGQKQRFDFAYITIHGTPGENGLLQGYFEMLHIPYSCCGVLAAALTFDKYYCNTFLRSLGVETAASIYLRRGEQKSAEEIADQLGLPVFVKPSDGGSSFGVTKVHSTETMQAAIDAAFAEGGSVLIERFMAGTEVTCGCYKTYGKITVLPVTEVVSQNEFFDYEAKYNNRSEEITPARIPDTLTEEIQQTTAKIYDYIGAKGIIRVDYIISPEGKVRMLEVNTTPGMTSTSFIPQQIRAAGLDMKKVLTTLIENELK